jgi:hypothetical protein
MPPRKPPQITEFLIAADRAEDEPDDTPDPVVVRLVTPGKTEDEEDKVHELTMHYPGDGQLAAWMATSANFTTLEEKVAGTVNFFTSILEEHDHSYIVARLYDRKDDFGTRHMTDLLKHAMEEWGGRPTKQPSDFAPSRRSGGQRSTRRSPALTQ